MASVVRVRARVCVCVQACARAKERLKEAKAGEVAEKCSRVELSSGEKADGGAPVAGRSALCSVSELRQEKAPSIHHAQLSDVMTRNTGSSEEKARVEERKERRVKEEKKK